MVYLTFNNKFISDTTCNNEYESNKALDLYYQPIINYFLDVTNLNEFHDYIYNFFNLNESYSPLNLVIRFFYEVHLYPTTPAILYYPLLHSIIYKSIYHSHRSEHQSLNMRP